MIKFVVNIKKKRPIPKKGTGLNLFFFAAKNYSAG